MARTLGIIGGGQLGMMLAEAAREMPEHVSKVVVLDPTEDCPASQAGAEQIVGDFKDRDAIVRLADRCDIITYEIESGDSAVLESVQGRAEVSPSPKTLRTIQDKLLQKEFLRDNGIAVAEFARIGGMGDLEAVMGRFGLPVLLKARRDAYDGRGNYKIGSEGQAREAYDHFGKRELFVERFVPFRMEVSVIASRNTRGQIRTYPLVENIHEDNILRQTIAPARVSDAVAEGAKKIAERTMSVLEGAGVFGIEMFVTRDDQILINEIAPRVHNSGHHSLQSSRTSQFEQHLRAILGLELGDTDLIHETVMYNILGSKGFEGRYEPPDIGGKNVFLKMYGKKISKPQRKLGHVNIVAGDGQGMDHVLEELKRIRPMASVRPAD